MRRSHFLAFNPVCPVCRINNGSEHALLIAKVIDESDSDIREGILTCSNRDCQREFPIIDGIPILVGPLRSYVSDNVYPALFRSDLSEDLESLLGDCLGPATAFDQQRQLLSAYASDHYADSLQSNSKIGQEPGSVIKTLRRALQLAGPLPQGPAVDLGCSVGRTTFELAQCHDDLVLGVDLNFSMLRLASQVLRTGQGRFPRRRVGLVYDRCDFKFDSHRAQNVDFWACDVLALPFRSPRLALAVGLNIVDCVSNPMEFLKMACRDLVTGGKLIVTTPFDWSPSATPVEAWLGGHSQRSAQHGASELFIRKLFSGDDPARIPGMQLIAEEKSVPWRVRLHDRATMDYEVDLFVASKQ